MKDITDHSFESFLPGSPLSAAARTSAAPNDSTSAPLPSEPTTPTDRSPARRTVVKAAAATAAAGTAFLPLATATRASAASTPTFSHGVASGDPLPDGVLLWTRVTPTSDALPGSGKGPHVEVRWSVATDQGFRDTVAHGTVTTGPGADHTVKADVRGLSPAKDYWYRFTVDGVHSPTGRTRTAPARNATVDRLRLGVVSCANWEAGYFSAYRHLAARGDLDAVLILGDYIYEHGSGEYPARDRVVRPHKPAHEITTLADYRLRHGTYRTDADLQALHASHPVIAIWDDHEFANHAYQGGAQNHTPGVEGTWATRSAAAKQAYFEWMPVRPSVQGTVYRHLRYGKLADISLLDLRSFRAKQSNIGGGDIDDPTRSITGDPQMEWLKSGLERSDTTWRLVGNPVIISPVALFALPAYLLRPLTELLGLPQGGLAINPDQWDGYTADRRELLGHLKGKGIRNTVFLTGDFHSAWVSEVPAEAATYPRSGSVATEFVVTSMTSDNLDDILKVPAHTVSKLAVATLKSTNRHLKWIDLDSHGYGVFEVTPEHAQMDYYGLSDRTRPDATSHWLRSYRTRSGTQRMERASAPVR